MASTTPEPPQVECENIIIKRRRKRLLPPEPCSVAVQPCITAREPLDSILSDETRPTDIQPADDEGNRVEEACPLSIDGLTPGPEGSTGENSLIHSDFGSHSESALAGTDIHDHGGQPITVHEFLRDITSSKHGRKYGRRIRPGTVKLDAHDHGQQCQRSPGGPGGPSGLSTLTSNRNIETQIRDDDQLISYPQRGRVRSEHLSRQVPHLRRKKRFAKSLAQRLFEADVFSSGTSSLSNPTAGVTPNQNLAHTSSRRPLQFITSLNLTRSMESRIYGKKAQPRFGNPRTETPSGSLDSEIQPVSQTDGPVPDFLQGEEDDCQTVTTCQAVGKLTNRNWDGAATTRKGRRTQARVSHTAMRGSGKRVFRTRHGGGKQSSAQVPHNPFEYVPLPLVRVENRVNAVKDSDPEDRCQLCANPNPVQACTGGQGQGTHGLRGY